MTLAVVGIVRIHISLMNAYHKALQVYPVNIHYMIVLSELENYSLPTINHILFREKNRIKKSQFQVAVTQDSNGKKLIDFSYHCSRINPFIKLLRREVSELHCHFF